MSSKPKILFMGTPEFAIPSLAILIRNDYPIIGIATQPDRPKGRSKAATPPPVKIFAREHGLEVIQPERVRDQVFLDHFRHLSPDMLVLVAFGQILSGEIIETPKLGCINIHPSLLPKYRGAAPINWTLIQGETKTGVTIMLMNEGIDSGDILLQEETPIEPEETYDSLHDRLSKMGAELLLKTIALIERGTVRRISQDSSAATYAPRLKKEDGLIHWDNDAASVINLIRGLSSTPGAYTFLDGKKLKILKAKGGESQVSDTVGKIGRETDKGLPVTAKNGIVYLQDIQMESKKRMPIKEFLRGYRIKPGSILG